jgi:catechol 2,3-dioxygenase-like lactoylglutathione lyase family enzyme
MLIPILVVRDMAEAIAFHTQVLDFRLDFAWPEEAPIYAGLRRGGDEMHLALAQGGSRAGPCSAMVLCDDVDALFAGFRARGLAVPIRPESPVHEGPLDQSWGTREVYIDDPSGNTLIFQQR